MTGVEWMVLTRSPSDQNPLHPRPPLAHSKRKHPKRRRQAPRRARILEPIHQERGAKNPDRCFLPRRRCRAGRHATGSMSEAAAVAARAAVRGHDLFAGVVAELSDVAWVAWDGAVERAKCCDGREGGRGGQGRDLRGWATAGTGGASLAFSSVLSSQGIVKAALMSIS